MLYRVNLIINFKPYISLPKSFNFATINCINKTIKGLYEAHISKEAYLINPIGKKVRKYES